MEGWEVDSKDSGLKRSVQGLSKPEIVMINQQATVLSRQAWELCREELMRQAVAMKASGIAHLDEPTVAAMAVKFFVQPADASLDDKPF